MDGTFNLRFAVVLLAAAAVVVFFLGPLFHAEHKYCNTYDL